MMKTVEVSDSQILKLFGRHMLAMSVTFSPFHNYNGDEIPTQYKFFPGVLIRIRNVLFFLTAGHSCEEIKQAIDAGVNIKCAHLHDTFGQDVTCHEPISYFLNLDKFLIINNDHHGLDIAAVVVTPYYERQLFSNGVIPLEESHWCRQSEIEYDHFSMLGIPDESISVSPDGVLTLAPTILPLSQHPSPPKEITETVFERFIGKHGDLDPIKGLKGMSGGPVFGFKKEPQLRYWIIGIQSGWVRDKNLVYATKITTIASLLTALVEDIAA